MGRLAGKTALITGAARGQGEAEARLFAAEGAAVMLCDVLDAQGNAVAADITAAGHQARYTHLDVADPAAWAEAVAQLHAWRGRIDILVNNAGINDRGGILSTPPEAWARTLGVNLTGPLNGMRAVAEIMRDGGGGSIVNIASLAGFQGSLGAAYTSSKWALRGLSRVAAMEFVDWNIRVNTVCPGLIVTGLNAHAAYLGPMQRMTPMGRAGTVEEVARTVLFLASDDASYITGEDIVVDGGFRAGAGARRMALDSGIDLHRGAG